MTLGIEVGDQAITAAVVDRDATVIARDTREGISAAIAADLVRAVDSHHPTQLGVAVSDPMDSGAAAVIAAAADAARVQAPPRVVTRGSAVALAEQWSGAAHGAAHVVALMAGDSVHAGVVAHGRVFEGAHGLAGAARWLALNPVERDDYRRLGCLEAEIGAPGIVRRLVWRLKAGDTSRALELAGGDMGAVTVAHVFDAARDGDGVAISVVRDTARYVGMAIGNLVAILDPEIVVLGGLIADAGDLLIEPSRAEAARRISSRVAQTLNIVPGALGQQAGAIGAARAAMLAE